MALKYYTIFLDGIDKSGKDTIANYIWRLDKRLNVLCRGWPSLYVYDKKFERHTEYELPPKQIIYVHIFVEKDDWQIRCEATNEPKINYDKDLQLFDNAFNILKQNKYKVFEYSSSEMTPYEIAKDVIMRVKKLNKEL